MANLSIRNLDDTVADLLRKRAGHNGVSMEEEVRRILRAAVVAPVSIADLATGLFGPKHGIEFELPAHPASDPPNFD